MAMKLSLVSRLVLLVLAITLMATAILALIVHRTTSLEFVTSVREELLQAVDPEVKTPSQKLLRAYTMTAAPNPS